MTIAAAAIAALIGLIPAEDVPPVPAVWHDLAVCETGMSPTGVGERLPRWHYNGRSGFDGGLQHHPDTWTDHRLAGYPAEAWKATPWQQVAVARRVLAAQGEQAWPVCGPAAGLAERTRR